MLFLFCSKTNTSIRSYETAYLAILAKYDGKVDVLSITNFIEDHLSDLRSCVVFKKDEFSTNETNWKMKFVTSLVSLNLANKIISEPEFFTTLLDSIENSITESEFDWLGDALELLIVSLYRAIPSSTDLVIKWFNIIKKTQVFRAPVSSSISMERTASLLIISTLGFLDLSQDWENIPDGAYILNKQQLVEIDHIVQDSISEPILLLGWSLIREMAKILEIIDNDELQPFQFPDPNSAPFITRVLTLWKSSAYISLESRDINRSLLLASMPFLYTNEAVGKWIAEVAPEDFVGLDRFGEELLASAKARVPLRVSPFLNIIGTIDSDVVYKYIKSMDTFMMRYDAKNSVKIESISEINNGLLVIPKGTSGNCLVSGVVVWNLNYNGWVCFSKMLKIWNQIDYDDSIEIVKMFTRLTRTLNGEDLNELFYNCSVELSDTDFIQLILDLIDTTASSRKTELASECLNFADALTLLHPERVWSFLAISQLLGRNADIPLMSSVLGTTESIDGRYEFTISLLQLTKSLISAAISHTLDTTISIKVQKEVLFKLVSHTVSIFEYFRYWTFKSEDEKYKIASLCLKIFTLIYSFNLETEAKFPVLCDVMSYMNEKVLSDSAISLRVLQPAFDLLEFASVQLKGSSHEIIGLIEDVLDFLTITVRARSQLKIKTVSLLEKHLYKVIPQLAQISLKSSFLRPAVFRVLSELISADWDSPFSLLTHLGKDAKVVDLAIKRVFNDSLESSSTVKAVAKFVESVIGKTGKGQDGFAIYLMTGEITTNINQKLDVKDLATSEKSILHLMQKRLVSLLSDKPDLSTFSVASQLLSTLQVAYRNWSAGNFKIDPELIKTLTKNLEETFEANSNFSAESYDSIDEYCLRNSFSEKSLILLTDWKRRNKLKLNDLGFSVKQLTEFNNVFTKLQVIDIADWDAQQVVKTFQLHWGALDSLITSDGQHEIKGLRKFAKVKNVEFGPLNYLYDVKLIDHVLQYLDSWPGLRNDVIAANRKCSWMDSQLGLLKAWCLFLISLVLESHHNTELDNNSRLLLAHSSLINVVKEDPKLKSLKSALISRIELVSQMKKTHKDSTDPKTFGSPYLEEIFVNLVQVWDYMPFENTLYRALISYFPPHTATLSFKLEQSIKVLLEKISSSSSIFSIVLLQKASLIPTVTLPVNKVISSGALLTEPLNLNFMLKWLGFDRANGVIANYLLDHGLIRSLYIFNSMPSPNLLSSENLIVILIELFVQSNRSTRVAVEIQDYFNEYFKSILESWQDPSVISVLHAQQTSQVVMLLKLIQPAENFWNKAFDQVRASINYLFGHPRYLEMIIVSGDSVDEMRTSLELLKKDLEMDYETM